MKFCARCQREISEPLAGLPSSGQPSASESADGRMGPEQDGTVWSPIARLTNLAEVGYFADVLQGAGFATNVQQQNDFSALDGRWQSLFILRVPNADAQAAADRLRTEVANHAPGDEDTGDEDRGEFEGELPTGASQRGGLLTPILVILIAGGLAYVAGRGGLGGGPGGRLGGGLEGRPGGGLEGRQRDEHPDHANHDLRRALSETDRPWISQSQPDGAGPVRRLQFDAQSQVLVLEDDWDGDGKFERQRRFRVPR